MNYIIQTPKLNEEILKSVSEKADANGNGIVNWQCVETDGGDKALDAIELLLNKSYCREAGI